MENGFYTSNFQYLNYHNFRSGEIIRLSRAAVVPKNDFLDAPFDFVEFNLALDSKRPDSAAGLDGVDFEILQRLPTKYKLLLLDIFNSMYEKSLFPEDWSNTFIHFIPKSDGISYRPIALTSCVCKLLKIECSGGLKKTT